MAPIPWAADLHLHGTFNGDFLDVTAHGAGEGDGVANWTGNVGDGDFDHSTWIWGHFLHYGFAYMPEGKVANPTDKYGHKMTRHWYGEDGAHMWASCNVKGAEGAWAGDYHVVAEHFGKYGPIMKKQLRGQFPSHWVATKRSDTKVDVHGLITYKVEGGATYTAHVHDEVTFFEPVVELTRHYWKVEYPEGEYFKDHFYHKEIAIADACWNFGNTKDKMGFNWSLMGSINNKAITANGYGYGFGYRQHQWGTGAEGYGEYGLPNLNYALAWEGHAGLHFFTRFPRGVTNPFNYTLPEGFTISRRWFGQDGAHWTSTHDLKMVDGAFNKRISLVGKGFPKEGVMTATPKTPELMIVKTYPQYVLAVPKGNNHIWYRGTFQFKLANGSYYSGYWEMDMHFRKPCDQMPNPYVVRFVPESWTSDAFGWGFYEREEVEQSTYDKEVKKEVKIKEPVAELAASEMTRFLSPIVKTACKSCPDMMNAINVKV